MIRKGFIRIHLLLLLTLLAGNRVWAQSPVDSAAFVDAAWSVLSDRDGMVVKRLTIRLFNSDQQISCIELSPARYRLAVVQDSLRQKTSLLAKKQDAVAAVNGGFFKTKTPLAIASGYVRVNGQPSAHLEANYGGVLAVDTTGALHLMPWKADMERDEWMQRYSDVMVSGPLLVQKGCSLLKWDSAEPRHPRSCIGIRKDGTLVLMVVDGRRRRAAGMALCELAYITRLAGMTTALNLDGGGSSTLWTRQKGILNTPSDGSERPVCNAVVVTKR